jgi:hypothetical protein
MLINLPDFIQREDLLDQTYLGKVVDNNDPLKLGRVKCEIQGLLVGPKEKLPWIAQRTLSSMGGKLGRGSFVVPDIGSELEIIFPYCDIYIGFYIGHWQSSTTHLTDFDANYPNMWGLVDQGFKIIYNNQTKDFKIEHPEGTVLNIASNGDVNINTTKKVNINSSDADINTSGNANINAGGSINVNAGGTASINGSQVILANGTMGVARLGDKCQGIGNAGFPVISTIIEGSGKVLAGD